ncbi:MAG TPA: hypothetical protein VLB29_19055 [Nocardioidaceae bacterium]|nr:hypothetical protein [Nocardioidaceae bacterium]
MVTWTTAATTAAFTVCLAATALLFGGPLFDVFQGHRLQWYVAGAALVVIALSAAAGGLATLVFRRRRWARWALVALSVVAAVGGAMLGYYVAPLAITAAALAVVVLLFLPPARAWFRLPATGHAGSPT